MASTEAQRKYWREHARKNRERKKANFARWLAKPGNAEKHRAYQKEYGARYYREKVKTNPDLVQERNDDTRWRRRLRKYGITKEAYLLKMDAQNGRCATCLEYHGLNLRVDHDHETGEVRDLLCSNCNAGLGMFKEDPKRLKAAIRYLRRHNKEVEEKQ